MDIEEAIEKLKETARQCHNSKECWENEDCCDCYVEVEDIFAIETVLSELEKKEAVINEMSKFIANLKLSWFKKEDGGEFLGKYRFYNQEEWIEYFTNKVEREGK